MSDELEMVIAECPLCGTKHYGKFCHTCGSVLISLPEPLKCECGEEIGENDYYCRWCGKRISDGKETGVVTPQARQNLIRRKIKS